MSENRTHRRRRACTLAAGLLTSLLAAHVPAARADAGASPPAAASRGVRTEPVPIPGSSLVRGRSTIVVDAPLARVRAAVLDFPRYPEFMPHFNACRVLGRSASGGRDLYVEVAALRGAVKMWARVDAQKATRADGIETHAIRFVEGNVRALSAVWRLKPLEEGKTELSLEIFLHPRLPLPAKLINRENLDGSARGVAAVRARAEAEREK